MSPVKREGGAEVGTKIGTGWSGVCGVGRVRWWSDGGCLNASGNLESAQWGSEF